MGLLAAHLKWSKMIFFIFFHSLWLSTETVRRLDLFLYRKFDPDRFGRLLIRCLTRETVGSSSINLHVLAILASELALAQMVSPNYLRNLFQLFDEGRDALSARDTFTLKVITASYAAESP